MIWKGIVFDLHGVLVFDFDVEEYHRKVFAFFPKRKFHSLKRQYGTGAMVFVKFGLKKEYIEILDSLPIHTRKEKRINLLLKKLRCYVPLFLVTDTSRKNCLLTLKAAGYSPALFTKIITLEDVALPKPADEAYRKIGVSSGFIVFGDKATDLTAAAKLGAKTFLIKTKKQLLFNLQKILRELEAGEKRLK